MKQKIWAIPGKVFYIILISLIILLLTWTWFEREIRDIDIRIERLHKY